MVGIDLGSSWIGVCSGARVLREPAAVSLDTHTRRVLATGLEADQMEGRTTSSVQILHPVQMGVAAAPEHVVVLLRHALKHSLGWRRWVNRPRVTLAVPLGITPVEREALHEIVETAGARAVAFVPAPMAAARGAGLQPDGRRGTMLVDIGARQTQAAILYRGTLLASDFRPVGGHHLTAAIVRWLRQHHGLVVADSEAEALKRGDIRDRVTGWDVRLGGPGTAPVTADDLSEALQEPLAAMAALVRSVLTQTPPELASDLLDHGLTLTGGGALLPGLPDYLSRQSHLPVQVAPQPELCAAKGCQRRTS